MKSLSFAPFSQNSRENSAKVHQFLMNKFINSSKFGDELLFISNLAEWSARAAESGRSCRACARRRRRSGAAQKRAGCTPALDAKPFKLGAKKLHHYCIKWKWISGISRLSDYRVFSSRLSDYLFFLQIIEYLRVNIENL